MTEGEFSLVMAKLAERYRGGKTVLRVVISKHANECGLDIDEDGRYDEQMIIIRPLETFLVGVSAGMDALYQCATACLAWEAYQKYLRQKDMRVRATAAT